MATEVVKRYVRYGAAKHLFKLRDPEVLLAGPAGTGKSRACLEYLHKCALDYPGMRGAIVRKTRTSLTQAALVTFEQKVLHELDGVQFHTTQQAYLYPNGSTIVVGGLDKPQKVMSTEYDLVYVQEATELLENDWESLTTRLRNGVLPYQQLLADCNPDAPTHWLKRRCDAGKTRLLDSRHEDNPTVTPDYLARLDALTGVRYLRLRKGIWAAAEGVVYDTFDPAVHLIDPFPIPADWPRYWTVDFGYTNPFVAQWWAVDPDGRAYRYREVYHTQRLVEDHARQILELSKDEPRPQAVICDHDAEGRATLTKYLGIPTTPAYKAVTDGIQKVQTRLKVAGDGRPRLFLFRGALVERDAWLDEQKKPLCTEEEIDGYVWNENDGRKKGEEPVKENDHGCDALRYLCAHLDRTAWTAF